jgi:hypothetical protein
MATPRWTIEQYNALNAAYAEGVKTVQYSDKMVTYRSLDEMLRILNDMARDLGIGENAARPAAYAGRNVGCYVSGK